MSDMPKEIMVQTAYGPKDMIQIMKQLAEPFPLKDVEWRVGSTNRDKTSGIALPYITNRAVQDRLDGVMGIGFWRNSYEMWRNKGVLCGLALLLNGEWITKFDGADESDVEGTKGGFSDAMKRVGYQWGIGRYLYDLPQFWVDLEQKGNSHVIKGEPPWHKFPEWAIRKDELEAWRAKYKKGGGGSGSGTQGGGGTQSQTSGGGAQSSGMGLPKQPGAQPAQGAQPGQAGPQPNPGTPASGTPSEPTANTDGALTFRVKSAPTMQKAAQGVRKGQDYILVEAEDKDGKGCQVVGFEKAVMEALRGLSVGAQFTASLKMVSNSQRGPVYEMVSPLEKAS